MGKDIFTSIPDEETKEWRKKHRLEKQEEDEDKKEPMEEKIILEKT